MKKPVKQIAVLFVIFLACLVSSLAVKADPITMQLVAVNGAQQGGQRNAVGLGVVHHLLVQVLVDRHPPGSRPFLRRHSSSQECHIRCSTS